MKYLRNGFAVMIGVVLTACSQLPFDQAYLKTTTQSEFLKGYQIEGSSIVIQVVAHGCTFFTNYKLEVANQEKNSLRVVRLKPDNCSMKSRELSLRYSFKHLPLDFSRDIYIVNQLDSSAVNSLVEK